ncbi:HlyD family type I secretion periplasmic adaptor subunit [Azospirillum sp. sgz301742]
MASNDVVVLKPRRPAARRSAELEFLPAAIEILDRPPSPTVRIFSGAIMAFFALALAWSWFGELDVVAVAQGRIVPSGRVKVVQPMEIGTVRAIHVEDGTAVKAGDVLVELDATQALADRDRLASELATTRTEIARLTAALSDGDPLTAYVPPAGVPAALVQMHRQLLISQVAEQRAKLASMDRELARREADRATVVQAVAKLNATLPLVRERAEALHTLSLRGTASRFQYLELLQDQVEREQELLVQKTRLTEAEAAMASNAEQRRQAEAEYRRGLYTELTAAEQKAADLVQELGKAEQRVGRHRLTAPVDGTVQQLAVHTVGGVVTPAQALLVVVPEGSSLEVEAFIPNKDIGFVAEGQPVAVKIDTFNFTKYGLVPGRVSSVSGDAVQREEDTAEQGPVYSARIALDRTSLDVDGRTGSLAPGMAVSAEIKTGRRRILEYILSPLSRRTQEAFHER